MSSDTIFGLKPATVYALAGLSVVAMLAAIAFELMGLQSLPGLSGSEHVDFDMFHVVAQLALEGRVTEAYDLDAMLAAQHEMGGVPEHMTWTYPPPFDLLIAPFGALDRNLAFLLFTGASLALYLWTMLRLAGPMTGLALLGALPAAMMALRNGQNGCLTAGLIGLTCLALLRGRSGRAGIPLGLLVIKPHVALGLGLWALAAVRVRALLVALGTALMACLAATVALGTEVWVAFFDAIGVAGSQLEGGAYLNFRMASVFATLTSFGVEASVAMTAQLGTTLCTLAALVWVARRWPLRPALAIALLATPLLVPYLYDYDLALYGIAMALLLPELELRGRQAAALPLLVLGWIAGGTGLVQNARGAAEGLVAPVTGAGIAASALLLLALAVLRPREARPSDTAQQDVAQARA
ncbi:MAG: glycosyltransferase family 87 protein [Pseudomonadota bacterium]